MIFQFHKLQKLGRENLELTFKMLSATSGPTQAITNELAEYSRKVLQQSAVACERLASAKTLNETVDVQSDNAKAALDDLFVQSKRMNELYQNFAREAAKSLESALAGRTMRPMETPAAAEPSANKTDVKAEAQEPRVVESNPIDDAIARAVRQIAEVTRQAIN